MQHPITLAREITRLNAQLSEQAARVEAAESSWREEAKARHTAEVLYKESNTGFGNRMALHASHDATRAKLFEARAEAAEQSLKTATKMLDEVLDMAANEEIHVPAEMQNKWQLFVTTGKYK